MKLINKQGFKQTEVGLIPDDWNYIEFGELISHLCYGPRFSSKDYCKVGNVKTIRGTDINLLGDILYDQVPIAQLPNELVNEHKLGDGDLVMITTADCGVTGVYFDDGFPYIASAYAVRISLNARAYPLFFKYIFQTNLAKKQIELYIRKGTVGNLPGSDIFKLKFPLPPTLTEQNAIATALSDVDELINGLENLITKKKAVKKGAMQQLLTPPYKGGKRLAGFSGEWVEKTLGELSHIKTGSRNNQDKVEDGEYPFYVRSQSVKRIDTYSYDEEAVLIPGEGGIGTIFHYINGKFEVHQRVYKISSFSEGVFGKFIFLKMKHEFYEHAMTNSVKATVDSLRLPTFHEFEICLPQTLEEQKAIAQILSDMDADIEQLESKKAKYHNIKQGMMQELLTGKTRLI